MPRQTVIVLYGTPIEGFIDLKRFCKLKGLKYNTWARKKLPTTYNGASLERITNENKFDAIEVMGEIIKIQ